MSRYNHTPKSYPDPLGYKQLIRDPAFVAGVYEGRGNVYGDSSRDKPLVMTSQNVSLLSVLQEEYGGTLVPYVNERVKHAPDTGVIVSFQLGLGLADRKRFLKVAQPHVISEKEKVASIIAKQAA